MSTVVKDNTEKSTPAPAGLHQAVCVDVWDMGIVATGFGPKHKMMLVWQIPDVNPETGKRFLAFKSYSASLNAKSNLAKDIANWRGKAISTEEAKTGFDLEILVEKNCQIQITHDPGDGGDVWANVQTIVPIRSDMERLRPLDYIRKKDRPAQGNGNGKAHEQFDTPSSAKSPDSF